MLRVEPLGYVRLFYASVSTRGFMMSLALSVVWEAERGQTNLNLIEQSGRNVTYPNNYKSKGVIGITSHN